MKYFIKYSFYVILLFFVPLQSARLDLQKVKNWAEKDDVTLWSTKQYQDNLTYINQFLSTNKSTPLASYKDKIIKKYEQAHLMDEQGQEAIPAVVPITPKTTKPLPIIPQKKSLIATPKKPNENNVKEDNFALTEEHISPKNQNLPLAVEEQPDRLTISEEDSTIAQTSTILPTPAHKNLNAPKIPLPVFKKSLTSEEEIIYEPSDQEKEDQITEESAIKTGPQEMSLPSATIEEEQAALNTLTAIITQLAKLDNWLNTNERSKIFTTIDLQPLITIIKSNSLRPLYSHIITSLNAIGSNPSSPVYKPILIGTKELIDESNISEKTDLKAAIDKILQLAKTWEKQQISQLQKAYAGISSSEEEVSTESNQEVLPIATKEQETLALTMFQEIIDTLKLVQNWHDIDSPAKLYYTGISPKIDALHKLTSSTSLDDTYKPILRALDLMLRNPEDNSKVWRLGDDDKAYDNGLVNIQITLDQTNAKEKKLSSMLKQLIAIGGRLQQNQIDEHKAKLDAIHSNNPTINESLVLLGEAIAIFLDGNKTELEKIKAIQKKLRLIENMDLEQGGPEILGKIVKNLANVLDSLVTLPWTIALKEEALIRTTKNLNDITVSIHKATLSDDLKKRLYVLTMQLDDIGSAIYRDENPVHIPTKTPDYSIDENIRPLLLLDEIVAQLLAETSQNDFSWVDEQLKNYQQSFDQSSKIGAIYLDFSQAIKAALTKNKDEFNKQYASIENAIKPIEDTMLRDALSLRLINLNRLYKKISEQTTIENNIKKIHALLLNERTKQLEEKIDNALKDVHEHKSVQLPQIKESEKGKRFAQLYNHIFHMLNALGKPNFGQFKRDAENLFSQVKKDSREEWLATNTPGDTYLPEPKNSLYLKLIDLRIKQIAALHEELQKQPSIKKDSPKENVGR